MTCYLLEDFSEHYCHKINEGRQSYPSDAAPIEDDKIVVKQAGSDIFDQNS